MNELHAKHYRQQDSILHESSNPWTSMTRITTDTVAQHITSVIASSSLQTLTSAYNGKRTY